MCRFIALIGFLLLFLQSPLAMAAKKDWSYWDKAMFLGVETLDLKKVTWAISGLRSASINATDDSGNTALMLAAKIGDASIVHELIQYKADIHARNNAGENALIVAAAAGNEEIVKIFLEKGLNINSRAANGDTALIAAARSGKGKVVEQLIQSRANIVARNQSKKDAFEEALANYARPSARSAQGEAILQLLKAGYRPDPSLNAIPFLVAIRHPDAAKILVSDSQQNLDAVDSTGRTALVHAIDTKQEDLALSLLSKGARMDSGFYHPLFSTAYTDEIRVASALLSKGADVNMRKSEGETPLWIATQLRNSSVAKLLLQNGANPNLRKKDGAFPLVFAVQSDDADLVQLLLEKGADVEARMNPKDSSALSKVMDRSGSSIPSRIANHLIKGGADIRALNSSHETALMWAIKNNYLDVVKLLLEKNAALEAKNPAGQAALAFAIFYDRKEAIELLLTAGANPNAQTADGSTALMWAVHKNDRDLVKFILSKKPDLNIRNKKGRTALTESYLEKYVQNFEIINDLVSAGADPNTHPNYSILHLAAARGNEALTKLLIEKKADVNAVDAYGKTPLLHAFSNRHTPTIEILLNANANPALGRLDNKSAFEVTRATGYPALSKLIVRNLVNLFSQAKLRDVEYDGNVGHMSYKNPALDAVKNELLKVLTFDPTLFKQVVDELPADKKNQLLADTNSQDPQTRIEFFDLMAATLSDGMKNDAKEKGLNIELDSLLVRRLSKAALNHFFGNETGEDNLPLLILRSSDQVLLLCASDKMNVKYGDRPIEKTSVSLSRFVSASLVSESALIEASKNETEIIWECGKDKFDLKLLSKEFNFEVKPRIDISKAMADNRLNVLSTFAATDTMSATDRMAFMAAMALSGYLPVSITEVPDVEAAFKEEFKNSDMFIPVAHSINLEKFHIGRKAGVLVHLKALRDNPEQPGKKMEVHLKVLFPPTPQQGSGDRLELSSDAISNLLCERHDIRSSPMTVLNLSCSSYREPDAWTRAFLKSGERIAAKEADYKLQDVPFVIGAKRSFDTSSIPALISHMQYALDSIDVVSSNGTAQDLIKSLEKPKGGRPTYGPACNIGLYSNGMQKTKVTGFAIRKIIYENAYEF